MRQIARAQMLADHQFADVHAKLAGNIRRQALDLHFARDHFKNAALQLHALRLAERVHRHA